MAWKHKVDLAADWKAARCGEISPQELGKRVARKLTVLPEYPNNTHLFDIVCDFESLHEKATFDDFDIVLEDLYDWGDQRVGCHTNMCLISTY